MRSEGKDSQRHLPVRLYQTVSRASPLITFASTLATDRGFKERVREDMLVRLLDAFVWRNHGNHVHRRTP